jgi:hypothetical protein
MNGINQAIENKLRPLLNNLREDIECEIRIGKFIPNKYNNYKKFESSVNIDFFYKLKNIIESDKNIVKEQIFTIDTIYENLSSRGKIRETIYTDQEFKKEMKKEYMLKNINNNFDIEDYDIRISTAKETLITFDTTNKNPIFYRYKNRTTYILPNLGKLDLTIVNQHKDKDSAFKTPSIYEVELEITKGNYTGVLNMLNLILQTKQNTTLDVISNSEKNNVINQYKQLIGQHYFIGVQPETLQKDKLSLLYNEEYSVTDKADGDRYFLFIDSNKIVYFLDSNINSIIKTNLISTEYYSTLIDGELIEIDQVKHFYAFDLLAYNNLDIRENNDFYLKERLSKLKTITESIQNTNEFNIHIKKFISQHVFMGADIIMSEINNKIYKNDGLIFTPMNEPYPKVKKWIKLLKWKPAELNTIDFYSIKNDNQEWELYVQVANNNPGFKNKNNEKVLFKVDELCNVYDQTTDITFKTTFSENLLDPLTQKPFLSETVIEYYWDFNERKFVPLRTRWDKTANRSKHGNFSHVACSIWNSINNPITLSHLTQLTNSTTISKTENFFF